MYLARTVSNVSNVILQIKKNKIKKPPKKRRNYCPANSVDILFTICQEYSTRTFLKLIVVGSNDCLTVTEYTLVDN